MDAGLAFGNAIKERDSSKAKSKLSPELWSRLDTWLSNRAKYDCPWVWDLDENLWQAGGWGSEETGSAHFTAWFHCIGYRLVLNDFKLSFVENLWIVSEWGQLCESTQDADECDPPK